MVRRVLIAWLAGAVLSAGVTPVLAQPTAPPSPADRQAALERKKEKEREHKARQASAKPSTVVFVRLLQENNTAKLVVASPGDTTRTTTVAIQSVKNDTGPVVPDAKLVDLAKAIEPGKKIRIWIYTEYGQMQISVIALLDEKGNELTPEATAQYIEDHYACLFEKYTETVVVQKPQITVTISRAGVSDTLYVPVVRDAQGVLAPDTAIADRVRTLKKGEKIEFRLVPESKTLRSIRRKDDPDQGSFAGWDEKKIDGRKWFILQVKDTCGFIDSFLTRDNRIAAKARQLTPGQAVEYKTKIEGDLPIVTYLEFPHKTNDVPINIKALGEKPAKFK